MPTEIWEPMGYKERPILIATYTRQEFKDRQGLLGHCSVHRFWLPENNKMYEETLGKDKRNCQRKQFNVSTSLAVLPSFSISRNVCNCDKKEIMTFYYLLISEESPVLLPVRPSIHPSRILCSCAPKKQGNYFQSQPSRVFTIS